MSSSDLRYCDRCNKKTLISYNLGGVPFCSECKWEYSKPRFEAQAFICCYCEGGYDETYPGQTVCNECSAIPPEAW